MSFNNAPCEQIPNCTNIKIPNGEELLFNQSAQCIPLIRSFLNNNGDQVSRVFFFFLSIGHTE